MKRSHAGIVFTQWSKNGFFTQQGQHVVPINVKFGTGERTVPCQISRLSGQKCGNTAPKTVKISNFGNKICASVTTCLQYFYEILRVSMHL